ncbi:hypothetical protein [Glaciimonas sp. PAMC28666]|uniref:hypothetical protein n=1 Tax=Glaciimonas sp. PAMC28666 TaxID=2807626 RepID=UPI001963972A|nr:hypothetical protein [Glaciimonas sp. PAMC28666]QRX81331.1 hypothetical protein JQN73_14210 [Glaciimonas sp. PAMC28666]
MEFIPFEVVTVSEAKAVLEKDHVADEKEVNWEHVRRSESPSDVKLNAATYKWVLTLPVEVWPLWLMKYFPRIANQFADTWGYRSACEALFEQLLMDQRGTRKGFPMTISREIMALKLCFESSSITPQIV